ncbi:MAG: MFS transporter [Alphaproteobacteria bacterium]|nr:MFS transporter [Alphaproteobacteria bacterium]
MTVASPRGSRTLVVAALGASQTLAWASSYYLPAVLGAPIAADLGLPTSAFFAVFSAALLLQAAFGPYVGTMIDRHGGRTVLTVSNLVLAAGLVMLGLAQGIVSLVIAWALLGIGMTMGLYDAAFAALTRLYGREARASITGITLLAGFASTLGWPASAWFEHMFGWREACLIWAAVNLVIAAPLNWFLFPPAPPAPSGVAEKGETRALEPPRGAMPILAFYFCTTAFVTGALQAHLLRFLEMTGATATAAIVAGTLVGPAQVAARLCEFGLMRTLHPVWSAKIAAILHPIGAGLLSALGHAGVPVFAIAYGAGNGMITIARGTLPLAIFGPAGYGLRTGLLSVPARLSVAAAPFLFGLLLDRVGVLAVLLTVGLNLMAFASLWLLRQRLATGVARAAGN